MLKKLVVTTLAVGLLGGLTLGSDALSYFSTACHRASEGVKRNVPVEFQIDRARQMLRDLSPEVRRSMEVIAKNEIELERLDERIRDSADRAEKSKRDILRLQSDLASDRQVFRYAGHSYDRGEVTEDLARRFTRHKVADETLEHLRPMQAARRANLDAARQKLTAMVAAQKELETEIVNLEARRQLVEVAQASSDVVLDDSRLARIKSLVADIRSRLDVSARLASADDAFPGEIPLDAPSAADVQDQVAAHFRLDAETDAVAATGGGKVAAVATAIELE